MRHIMWTSKSGNILSDLIISRVDVDALKAAYAAETDDTNIPEMDAATRIAWRYGYMNPRTN